jgi:aspartyl-tRNA(Asn)/glutamyl-tRNA(Gln) amidotransferase subunit C
MEKKDIEALAKLARVNLTEDEKALFAQDMGSILAYVDRIREVATEDRPAEIDQVRNIFREDIPKEYNLSQVENIKNQFPDRDGDYLKVKSIL